MEERNAADMVNDSQRIKLNGRDDSPCRECAERFIACSDKCPKDARGEYGHKAWKADLQKIKDARKAYVEDWLQDYKSRWTGDY